MKFLCLLINLTVKLNLLIELNRQTELGLFFQWNGGTERLTIFTPAQPVLTFH